LKYSELKQGDIVLFKRYNDIYEDEVYEDGSVIYVREDAKLVSISWLEGYKSRVDEVPFSKVIVKSDPQGEYMVFDNYSGKSVLLES